MKTKKQVKQAADGMLYVSVVSHPDGVTVRTYQRAATARDVYAAASGQAPDGAKVRVYPATVDPAKPATEDENIIPEGINALALNIARRCASRLIEHECTPTQARIYGALCAGRRGDDLDDPDAADMYAAARLGVLSALREGAPIETQARAGYSACNYHVYHSRSIRQSEQAMRTEYLQEGDELVSVARGIAAIVRKGARPGYIPAGAEDAPVSAVTVEDAAAVRDIIAQCSKQQRMVLYWSARGLSQRQTAAKMGLTPGTVAYHAAAVHKIARKLYPAGRPSRAAAKRDGASD